MIDPNGQIDRYELRERIGSGGMARVYKAWDTSLERLVAIKILHEHLADDSTFRARFEREAKIIAGFNHPNIVQVYDFNVVSQPDYPLYYMVMSYIPGQTLREVLEDAAAHNQRLPRDRVRQLVADLCAALGYAHLRGMVHRDVKPGNVILNEHGKAILTDFGIARMMQSNRLTQDGVSTGTPIYMSPEQANGQAGDARSDLYSLGIMVYEMLTGRPPFVDDNSLSVMLKHLREAPTPVSEFIGVRQFDDFFAKALAKDSVDRFQTADEFARAFEASFEVKDFEKTTILPSQHPIPVVKVGQPVTTSVFQTLSQKARANPRLSGAIGVAAVGAAALLILLLANATAPRETPPTPAPTEAVASITDDGEFFASDFSSSSDLSNQRWSTEGTAMLTRQFTADGRYQMRNIQTWTAETSIYPSDEVYKNVAITMVGRLETSSQPASGYGVVFRYQDENNYNVFAVDGMGRYSVWVRSDGEWIELRKAAENWTPSDSVNPLGEDNTLSVSIVGSTITGYVNDKRVAHVTDSTLPDGRIGIYFATDDGEATVSIASYRVDASVPSMTGS